MKKCIFLIISLILLLQSCSTDEVEQGRGEPFGDSRRIELYSTNGQYTLPADGVATLEFEAKVLVNDEAASNLELTFETNLGRVTPISSVTDANGVVNVVFTSGNLRGTATLTLFCRVLASYVEKEIVLY